MAIDLAIKNGKVVTTEGVFEAGVAVDNGTIVGVTKDPNLPSSSKTIDAKGNYVLPGLIDPHTHWGVYNLASLETFEQDVRTESISSAAGGVTTVMHCMMYAKSYNEVIPKKTAIVEKNSIIDVTYYATMMTPQHLTELEDYFEQGVISYKHFLLGNEYGAWGSFGVDDTLMYLSFQKLGRLGGVAMVHCENVGIMYGNLWNKLGGRTDLAPWNDMSALTAKEELKKFLASQGDNKLAAWTELRPEVSEHEGMMRCGYFAAITGVPLYVVHTTIGGGVDIAYEARKQGREYYLETCPQYLAFTKDDESIGVLGKVNPPLRTRADAERLWQGIFDGVIQCIGTDHCTPIRKSVKMGNGDVWTAIAGFPGTETMLPYMLSEGVKRRGLPLERIAQMCAFNAARIHRIPNKGAIAPGYDGDLTIVDLKIQKKVKPDILHSVDDFTLFDGWTFTGWPITTIVRGNVVMEDREIVGKPGAAQVLRRTPRPRKTEAWTT